jgi:hypothetical protein
MKSRPMKNRITRALAEFHWQQWLILAGFLLAVAFTGFRLYNTARSADHWRHHRDEPINGWMTVGHVAHSHHLPAEVLYDALGLPHQQPDKRPLRRIAKAQKRTLDEVRALLTETIAQYRSTHPEPSPRPKATPRGWKPRGSP